MRIAATLPIALAALVAVARPTAAQSRWKEIGKTSAGNSVFVDPASVKKVNGIVNARVRVVFAKPVETPQGNWMVSHSAAMFDCTKATVAAKETTYYSDAAATRVVDKRTNAKPGFGPALGGSMAKVALDYLCKAK